jgi:hypothetical protein
MSDASRKDAVAWLAHAKATSGPTTQIAIASAMLYAGDQLRRIAVVLETNPQREESHNEAQ